MSSRSGLLGTALVLALALPGMAQTKPGDDKTKIKKVMVYSFIGGWVHQEGIPALETVVKALGTEKGFEVTVVTQSNQLTANFINGFDLLIWNNNTNGAVSVPSAAARQAVLDFINNGKGWIGVHGAGDHADTWVELKDLIGTKFSRHGAQGNATINLDPNAQTNKELKMMVDGIKDKEVIFEEWYSFDASVRGKPGYTVVTTVTGASNVVYPTNDGSNETPSIWAKFPGKGRMLYTSVGHRADIYTQKSAWAKTMLWQNMRFAAGDFEFGCTTVGDPGYDATARVHDATMCQPSSISTGKSSRNDLVVAYGGMRTQLNFAHAEPITAKVRDLRGAVVWQKTFTAGASEIAVADGLKAGVYQLELRSGKSAANQRLVLR